VNRLDRREHRGVLAGAVVAFAVLLGMILAVSGSLWEFALISVALVAITLIVRNTLR
jgi:hypothetical protein